ncbi:hypothetical protein PV08_10476 [Exophiala spinifera]|uniref:Uncharacterized protein n=1 Tax=Exophiala spinifera TaxID=91928 RepID=A0A0D1Y868_9EURO|nr:uncharacterized protein PV08_10476 [Exophiala spinifera]KIW11176.1 hypothetical protein PV08_10476 [Exophiala spinifera]
MDDAAHAHPRSPAATLVRPRSTTALGLYEQQTNHTSPLSVPHNRQQRLLNTRHARFSAQTLSMNGISIPFPRLGKPTEIENPYYTTPRMAKRQDAAEAAERSQDMSSVSPRSSILNEITNSSGYRERSAQRRAPIPVFQDNPSTNSVDSGKQHTPSIYQDPPSEFQTPSVTGSRSTPESTAMGLREVSVNLHRTSPRKDSPSFRSIRSGSHRRSSHAKPRFNSEEYIDHIENELQMVKDAMYSPTTNTSWKEKLKKAKDENERLKKEMDVMRTSFELELQDTVERAAATELQLKRKIKDLEDEVALKQALIQDLEIDREEKRADQTTFEVLRARLDRVEEEKASLAATNLDMMKRNEVLTQLLALSPTKAQHHFELPTPRRRSARPMSMIIPRAPSSPPARTPMSRPQSVVISPALPIADYFPFNAGSSPDAASAFGTTGASPKVPDDTGSVRSESSTSCPRLTNSHSRHMTNVSQVSSSSESTPHSDVRPSLPVRQPSKRRPRRFMPGSTQLKPLLLSTFTADNGNMPSTSPMTSPKRMLPSSLPCGPSDVPRKHHATDSRSTTGDFIGTSSPISPISETVGQPGPSFQSLDEVFDEHEERSRSEAINEALAKLTQGSDGAEYNTPVKTSDIEMTVKVPASGTSKSCPRVDSWLLRTSISTSEGEDSAYEADVDGGDNPMTSVLAGDSDRPNIAARRHLGHDVDIPRPLFSTQYDMPLGPTHSPSYYDESPLNPRQRHKSILGNKDRISGSFKAREKALKRASMPERTKQSLTTDPIIIEREVIDNTDRERHLPKRVRNTARPRHPLELLKQRNIGSRTLAAMTIRTVYATLTRYTSYIRSFRKDPLALARRVIANAWRVNWGTFGKLSWWVLGLFLGHRSIGYEESEWDWEQYDGESIAIKHCENTAVTVDTDAKPDELVASSDTPNGTACGNDPTCEANESLAKSTGSGWGQSLYLWGKFSVAIMLAVGGAIVKGPAEMLRETEDQKRSRQRGTEDDDQSQRPGTQQSEEETIGQSSGQDDQAQTRAFASGLEPRPPEHNIRRRRSHSSPTPAARDFRHEPSCTESCGVSGLTQPLELDTVDQPSALDHCQYLHDETPQPSRNNRLTVFLDAVMEQDNSDDMQILQLADPG